ncbi:MAG: hypothetical protein CM15mP120_06420 [Pseudomonadota bacterium]|nr:MAG: hypothetical protein CM15mP120_06420 [Pseudomonadota bacterium]
MEKRITEATIPWLYPQRNLRESMQINGLNIHAARAAGNGVLPRRAINLWLAISPANLWVTYGPVMYRANKNLVAEWLRFAVETLFSNVVERS